ncbi:TPM domain-containing protein [Planctomonas psychrotolerans]|uniref:TPM domain-containing protein n=1 Tax=Planctomonas psychrotolerans TaxID=2528712 RepID=UPI001D0D4644|nr:TPM domain-containing protein [Planctomonas psychrotolerans]
MRSRLLLTVLLVLGFVSVPLAAAADAPVDFDGGTIVDTVGVLGSQEVEVQAALDDLLSSTDQTLYVAYVDSFESPADRDAWVEATAELNQLGDNNVILAVAVDTRVYQLSAPDGTPLSGQTNQISTQYVLPELREDDWAGAAIAAAQGIEAAVNGTLSSGGGDGGNPATSSGSGLGGLLFILGLFLVVVLVGVIMLAVAARRKRRKEREKVEAAEREQQALDQRAGTLLVHMDDALKTSQQELGFAVAQFGSEVTRPYAEALASASTKVREAFTLKQQLEDAFPDTDQERFDWTNRIIELTEAANAELEEQAQSFDELRSIDENAPKTLNAIVSDAEAVSTRIGQAERTLARMSQQYEGETIASVAGNIDQARKLLDFAMESASEATSTLKSGGPSVALPVRAAQQSIDQSRQLLAAVDKVATGVETATQQIDKEIDDVRQDISEARRLTSTMPHLRPLIEEAEHVIATARPRGGGRSDPIATVRRLQEVEARLDDALADSREQRAKTEKAHALLGRAMQTADAQVSAAVDFISTRRGAVGPHARQQLAEAERLYDEAHMLSATDPVAALAAAQRSSALASAAIREAQSDLDDYLHRRDDDDWFGGGGVVRRRGVGGGDAFTGAILGGVLGGMLGGGGGIFGGGGGGLGGGGFGGGGGGGGFGGGWSGSGGGFGGGGGGGSF